MSSAKISAACKMFKTLKYYWGNKICIICFIKLLILMTHIHTYIWMIQDLHYSDFSKELLEEEKEILLLLSFLVSRIPPRLFISPCAVCSDSFFSPPRLVIGLSSYRVMIILYCFQFLN